MLSAGDVNRADLVTRIYRLCAATTGKGAALRSRCADPE